LAEYKLVSQANRDARGQSGKSTGKTWSGWRVQAKQSMFLGWNLSLIPTQQFANHAVIFF
jgi:hypothetical protein